MPEEMSRRMRVAGTLDDDYRLLWEGLRRPKDPNDQVFLQALHAAHLGKTVPARLMERMHAALRAGVNRDQRIALRHVIVGRDMRMLELLCRHLSLLDEAAPKVGFGALSNILKAMDGGLCAEAADTEEQERGVAHALLSLRRSLAASYGRTLDQLAASCPELVRLFADHAGQSLHLHRFIAERKLTVTNLSDVELLRVLVQSPAAALDGGVI